MLGSESPGPRQHKVFWGVGTTPILEKTLRECRSKWKSFIIWLPINSGNRSGSCSENCGFRIAQVMRRHSENGISHSENYFLNSESCSENTPELSQSSENGLLTPRAFFPKLGWFPGFWSLHRLATSCLMMPFWQLCLDCWLLHVSCLHEVSNYREDMPENIDDPSCFLFVPTCFCACSVLGIQRYKTWIETQHRDNIQYRADTQCSSCCHKLEVFSRSWGRDQFIQRRAQGCIVGFALGHWYV